jgi:hypothetical protein
LRPPRRPAHELRVAIDCLPVETRQAMIAGVDANQIIVGAYTDRDGGVCPMLAAHRNGGRTSFASFARAWDRYTRAGKGPRKASKRELRTLRTMLEASIALEARGSGQLAVAIADHQELQARTAAERPPVQAPAREKRDTGERDRTAELRGKRGWSWLRPFRRFDEYEKAVAQLEEIAAERREGSAREHELV